MTTSSDNIWNGAYKIPWDDPDFSRRMLAAHLAQHHDLASRSLDWIDRQVAWIHDRLLGGRAARVLDLTCGPGFYAHRLSTRGHRVYGIDFGPASIEYAQQHAPEGSRCEFVLADVRDVAFGGPYELALFLYGEPNVFSPPELMAILRKARASLASEGRLLIEVQTPESIERMGRADPSEEDLDSGCFCDHPHRCRTDNRWLSEQAVAIQTFTVTQAGGEPKQIYRSTTKAWPDGELTELLTTAGFCDLARCDAWPCNTEDLALWIATAS